MAAKSVSSRHKFLLDGGRLALQPRALASLADILFRGIPDFNQRRHKLKDVLVIREGKIGADLKTVEAYPEHKLITFYFDTERPEA